MFFFEMHIYSIANIVSMQRDRTYNNLWAVGTVGTTVRRSGHYRTSNFHNVDCECD